VLAITQSIGSESGATPRLVLWVIQSTSTSMTRSSSQDTVMIASPEAGSSSGGVGRTLQPSPRRVRGWQAKVLSGIDGVTSAGSASLAVAEEDVWVCGIQLGAECRSEVSPAHAVGLAPGPSAPRNVSLFRLSMPVNELRRAIAAEDAAHPFGWQPAMVGGVGSGGPPIADRLDACLTEVGSLPMGTSGLCSLGWGLAAFPAQSVHVPSSGAGTPRLQGTTGGVEATVSAEGATDASTGKAVGSSADAWVWVLPVLAHSIEGGSSPSPGLP